MIKSLVVGVGLVLGAVWWFTGVSPVDVMFSLVDMAGMLLMAVIG